MRTYPTPVAAAAMAMVLAGISVVGCGSGSKSSPATPMSATSVVASQSSASVSTPVQSADYAGLLIKASDIKGPGSFTATPPISNPDGATTTFTSQDGTQVIVASIQILPDAGTAVSAWESAKATRDGYVHGVPEPIAIGTGGTAISGPSPDGAKGVTVLLFTEGRAFAEMEFDWPPDTLAPRGLVTDAGLKQDAAIKNGLTG